jgi:CHAT domain-containing protein/tetratricopeptide (TPR) repeat protein
VATAAAAVCLPGCARGPSAVESSDPYAQLISSAGSARLVEARLSGGAGYAPWQGPDATGTRTSRETPALIRLAAARLEQRYTEQPDAARLAQAGVARLLLGHADGAVLALEQAAADGDGAAVLIDLSAAYLARAAASTSGADLARALDAGLRATERDGTRPEAWANIALAAQRLHLVEAARDAWQTVARLEQSPGWRDEAMKADQALAAAPRHDTRVADIARLLDTSAGIPDSRLHSDPDIVRDVLERIVLVRWAEAVTSGQAGDERRWTGVAANLGARLTAETGDRQPSESVRLLVSACQARSAACLKTAEAYRTYVDGRVAWEHERTTDAYAAFDASAATLRRGSHPEAGWAAVHETLRDYYGGRFDAARARMAPVLADARRRGYLALAGRVAWMIGLLHLEAGRYGDALQHFQDALASFEPCRDRESLGAVHNLFSDYHRQVDEPSRAWEHQMVSLGALSASRTFKYSPYINMAATVATSEGLHRAALLMRTQSAREMRRLGATASHAQALGMVARSLVALGRLDEARRTLDEARVLLAGHTDREIAALVRGTLDNQTGQAFGSVDPALAIDALTRAIGFYRGRGSETILPSLFLTRGRAHDAAGAPDRAEDDWRAGLAYAIGHRRRGASDAQRVALLAARWGLYAALADVRARRHHDPAGAFDLLEQGRAINIAERAGLADTRRPITLAGVPARLPADTLLVVFATMPARTLVWAIDARGSRHFIVERTLTRLAGDVEALREAIVTRRDDDATHAATALFDALLGPAREQVGRATHLVVVPDGPLHDVPFAALRDSAAGAFVIEGRTVMVAPSVRFALEGGGRPALRAGQGGMALVVGNPARPGDSTGLAALPGSAREAAAVSAVYPRHVLLTGQDATRTRFLETLPGAAVVHFSGHALPNRGRPELSRLLLATTAGDAQGVVFTRDLDTLRLPATRVVVLAACETARGAVVSGEGVLGLVRGFLGAGAPSVVATLWRIDDMRSPRLFQAFHAAMAKGMAPAAALRDAQVRMLRDRSDSARMADWAAPVVVGRNVR